MRIFLAFAFAAFESAFLVSDTLGCETTLHADKDPIIALDEDATCNVEKRKEVIPGIL